MSRLFPFVSLRLSPHSPCPSVVHSPPAHSLSDTGVERSETNRDTKETDVKGRAEGVTSGLFPHPPSPRREPAAFGPDDER